jgi:hypothetical protein
MRLIRLLHGLVCSPSYLMVGCAIRQEKLRCAEETTTRTTLHDLLSAAHQRLSLGQNLSIPLGHESLRAIFPPPTRRSHLPRCRGISSRIIFSQSVHRDSPLGQLQISARLVIHEQLSSFCCVAKSWHLASSCLAKVLQVPSFFMQTLLWLSNIDGSFKEI